MVLNIIQENIKNLKILCEKYSIKTMYFFGSVCTENFNNNSDIDILISFKEISIEEYTGNYFKLHYDLENLFNKKIDLVTENSIKNPYFMESIENTKELIYAA